MNAMLIKRDSECAANRFGMATGRLRRFTRRAACVKNSVPMNHLHPITKQLVEARKAIEISVLELADRAGYSESMLQKMECGHRQPSLASLIVWAEVLGYDIVLQAK